ncbi:predicted protein [Nematostella vectensis]|uniref:Zinc finger MYND domain-containing protein 10 n=1 Tax=Nematostella vectensis TaxID=45351 RepID=A7S3C8_NEMVE|nr:predicted protein [Nematostella vectensis]|eukprot:XP_001633813.1 predicted protein [Nematostella vectensis]
MAAGEGELKTVLLAPEAELYVQELKTFPVKHIGSPKWMSQHEFVEKLNMQAVLCASSHTDEFVKDFLITLEKIPVLIHELIALELWKAKVFPKIIAAEGFNPQSTLPLYFTLFHEASLIGLLDTVLYHKDSCEAAEDNILDLLDYCHRKITHLIASQETGIVNDEEKTGTKGCDACSLEDLKAQENEITFAAAVKAVSIFSYITDHIKSISLSALTRILNTYDMPVVLTNLVESPPWVRRNKNGQLEKFIDSKWRIVNESDRMQLSKTEGQVWLALFHLLMNEDCQQKYEINDYKKSQILKLRGYLNEILLDQIPSLVDLQRYLEHLAIMEPPATKRDIILEQVPEVRDNLIKQNTGQWLKIADYQRKNYFTPSDSDVRKQAQAWAATYNLDALEELISEPPKCANCGKPATKRCSRCQNEWYCKRECQVKNWSKHKGICNLLAQSS